MKRFLVFILTLCLLAVSLTTFACNDDDGDKVSATEWAKAISCEDEEYYQINMVTKISDMGISATTEMKYAKNVTYAKMAGQESYAQISGDVIYSFVKDENGDWCRDEITQEEYELEFSAMGEIPDGLSYDNFEFNKKSTCYESKNDITLEEEIVLKDVSIKIKGTRMVEMTCTEVLGEITAEVSATFTYDKEELKVPTNYKDMAKEKYKITDEYDWDCAITCSYELGYELTVTNNGTQTIVASYETVYTDDSYYDLVYTSINGTETYYTYSYDWETEETFTYKYYKENGTWYRKAITEVEYEAYMPLEKISQTFLYSNFTYDENALSYKQVNDVDFDNYAIKNTTIQFKNNSLVSITTTLDFDNSDDTNSVLTVTIKEPLRQLPTDYVDVTEY